MGLLLAIEHPGTARDGPADEGPLEAAFDEVAADPVDGDRSDVTVQCLERDAISAPLAREDASAYLPGL
jgi:hypothetical protein